MWQTSSKTPRPSEKVEKNTGHKPDYRIIIGGSGMNFRKRTPVIRRRKSIPKEIMRHYHNNDTVSITYNNRIIKGRITDVNPIDETITLEKNNGRFFINISEITKVIS